MGIELPAELADVAARTGLAWPQADEDAMREQATAWRDAATEIGALASDADSAASGALEAMAGEAGDAASSMWATFVDPDNGSLTGAARGAQQSADRLEHAAEQVASAKVEMVRQLVDAAKNSDAAHAAADGGHPTALLALDTLLGGTATNLASVTGSLVGAVGDTGRAVDAPDLVNAHPGAHTAHGQSGLIGAVTGLGEDIVASVGATAREAPDVAGVLEPPQEAARDMAGSVSEAGGHTPDVVPEPVRAVAAPMVDAAAEPVPEVSPDAPTPPAGIPVGSTGGAGPSFADAPTPRSGIPVAGQYVPPADYNAGRTSLSGFADASPVGPGMSPAPAAPMPAAGPLPSAGPLPPAGSGSGFGGGQAFGAAPAAGAQPAPAPAPAGGQAPGGAQAGQPVARPGEAGRSQAPQTESHRHQAPPSPPQTSAPAPPSQPAVGTPRQDRQTVVAFFLVHMFPIGHLPVAANKPARQLPPPPAEADVAAGLRFPPHDHPNSATIDSLLQPDTTAGQHEGLPAEHPTVAVLSEDYDPLGGLHERDWDRRYLVKPDECSPEFAWPPCEVYPEGGYEEGEPVVLDAGAVLDRFGDPAGRVFGEDATPVRKRALPPAHLDAGYRRYRVLRALPMWHAVSAGWFGQPGGGPRYRAVYSAGELVSMGYLADITCDDSTGNDSTGNDSTGDDSTGESA